MTIRMDAAIEAAYRDDANTGVFFQRQLEYVKKKAYEIIYPPRKAMSLLPVNFDVPEGATSLTYELWDEVGMCKLIAASGRDVPRIDVNARQITSPIKPAAGAFGYNVMDVAAAQMAGVPLSQKKANATVKAFDRLLNKIAWNGDSDTAIPGLLSNANITTGTVPNDGTGSATEWSTKTPTLILRDMNLVAKAPVTATQDVSRPTHLLLPVDQHALIATTPISVDNTFTILKYFLENNPWIQVVETLPELKAANNSVYATDTMVAYRKDAEQLELIVPMPFKFLPVQMEGIEFVTNGIGSIGGTVIYEPLSVAIYDGI